MSGVQINLDYFSHSLSKTSSPALQASIAHLWLWIVVVGYILSIAGLAAIVYISVRLFELRKREEIYYSTLISPQGATGDVNPRWEHIESLINESNQSHWREAIIEADIMLDDALARRGYVGDGVGEKLKAVDPADLRTLQDAWDVHKVRNQIAHEGSAFDLSELLARRTIARYEGIFRELKVI
jgi:hypothetical protein